MKRTITKLKKYKEIKADIIHINLELEELEIDMLGITGQGEGERTGKTYKVTSPVEIQLDHYLEKKEKLLISRGRKERELARIDNALSVLKDEERDIIQTVLINGDKYSLLEIKYNRTYTRLKQIENKALRTIKKYIS
ncbi:hypothetical protein [Clostridium sp.]|uniref:hypothetical protein n=1 Tax=Clostridium sp. TaxID=1506 RepID=UPI0039905575